MYDAGDISERELKLIKHIAKKLFFRYPNNQITVEDLYHYGVIGFLDAKKRFNEEKKIPWFSYASIRINGEIIDFLRKQTIVRLPQNRKKKKDTERTYISTVEIDNVIEMPETSDERPDSILIKSEFYEILEKCLEKLTPKLNLPQ